LPAAEVSRKALEVIQVLPSKIATQIIAAGEFYPAETYHQDYFQ
jgi:peptide-methionine (S)-S-oxide reductase